MPESSRPSLSLPDAVRAWLRDGPPEAAEALACPVRLRLLVDAAHRLRLEQGERPTLPAPLDRKMLILVAIRSADLRYREATGLILDRIRDYEAYSLEGDPSRASIYREFGSWDFAKIAARDLEQFHFAKRRSAGGDRKKAEFSDLELSSAVLTYAEEHAGVFPSENDYTLWQRFRPWLPSAGQIKKRTAKDANGCGWPVVIADAKALALRDVHWPLTAASLKVDPS